MKPGRSFKFVPVADKPIQLARTERDTVHGILAFSALRTSLPDIEGESSAELLPGQVVFFDGDKTATWKGDEEGYGMFMRARKSTFTPDAKAA